MYQIRQRGTCDGEGAHRAISCNARITFASGGVRRTSFSIIAAPASEVEGPYQLVQ